MTAEQARVVVDLFESQLRRNRQRGVVACPQNTLLIVRGLWGQRLRYNTMAEQSELDGVACSESAITAIRCEIDARFSIAPTFEEVRRTLLHVASERPYHPARAYLEALPPWDSSSRWAALPFAVFGLRSPPPIAGRMLELWAISAVARAFEPGCQVDHVLVLQGAQALRKSTFFRALGGAWFGEGDVDTGQEGVRALSRKWLWCWDELAGLGKRERAALDGFITRSTDQLRPLYRDFIDHPRSTVIVATANPEDLLDNPEGLRRWWVVQVARRMEANEIVAIRDQLWAEALHRYRARERWWFESAEDERAHAQQIRKFEVVGPWDQELAAWVRSEAARALSLTGGRRGWITVADAVARLEIPVKDRKHAHSIEVGAALRRVGCEPVRTAGGAVARPELDGAKVSAYTLPMRAGDRFEHEQHLQQEESR